MRHLTRHILLFALCLPGMPLLAQQEASDVRRGNKHYNEQDYTAAEVDYRRGLEKNTNAFEAHYNLGDALFKQEKYPEAQAEFEKAASLLEADDKRNIADTYHNLGNAHFAQQQYDKAIDAYRRSLRANPKDDDTRYNLVKAMQMLQQQQQQQQQQQDKQEQQQNKDQQQQEQQNQQQDQQQQPQEQEQQQQPDEQTMDKETAEQILQALEQDEQETQEKLQRHQGSKKRVEKDW